MKDRYEKQYQEYARLLVEVGLNVQKGQTLVIACPVDCAWFARLCAGAAYDVGCRDVVMNWRDDALTRMKFLRAEDSVFDTIPEWQSHFFNDYAREGAAYLAVSASDPENLAGVDPDRMVRTRRAVARGQELFYRRQMANEIPWCVASIPIPAWAKKVFPDISEHEAMDRLWAAIFDAVPQTRIDIMVGDEVRILTGLFENFTGKVTAIDPETQKLTVVVPMLKRETTVELAYDEVVRES